MTARRVLVTGAAGQLGRALGGTAPAGWTVCGYDADELDITDAAAVRERVEAVRPAIVVNAAAWTAVDRAEAEPEAAYAVNARGAANVARAAAAAGARVVHVSTDFVFDGSIGRPLTPDDPVNPLGVYGRTKLEGEREVLAATDGAAVVVRTAWLYAAEGTNFVRTMLRLMAERAEVRVVADQIGTPTWARSLAGAIWTVAARPTVRGVHHWTDAGVASWYDFAVAIQEEALAAGLLARAVPVRPIASTEFPTPARRPAFSVLDKRATWEALGVEAEHWRVNLRHMLKELAGG